jgi:hypothetical protein
MVHKLIQKTMKCLIKGLSHDYKNLSQKIAAFQREQWL